MIGENTHKRGLKQSIDWKLIVVYILLVLIGWVNIFASIHSENPTSIIDWNFRCGKQFVWMLTSFGLAGFILFVLPPRFWESASVPMYLAVCALLVLVIFVSKDVKGSHSWFELGPVKFQPAEISKITTSLLLATVMSRQNFKLSEWKDFLLVAAIIAVPMGIIVLESETGSALVYAGFIFVLYREGFSGWWLALIGLVILLFITTLTLSPYTSILILIGILTVSNALRGPRKERWPRLGIGLGFVTLMAFLPQLWGLLQDGIQAHMDWMNRVTWVPKAGESDAYRWAFLLKVKPLYILLALSFLVLPFLGVRAFNRKDGFLGFSLAAFVIGVALVFSTDYIFENILQDHQRSRIEVLLGMKEDLAGVGYNVNQAGNPDRLRLRPGADDGLHLLHRGRGMGLLRLSGGYPAIRFPDRSAHPGRRALPGELQPHLRLLCRLVHLYASFHQHRNDRGPDARHRHSLAPAELRRLLPLGLHDPDLHLRGPVPAGEEVFLDSRAALGMTME